MFQRQTFRPASAGGAFLPQVRLMGYPRPAGPPAQSRAFLGLSLEDGKRYYDRAKAAVAKFDSLVVRTSKIAYKPARDAIVERYGLDEPGNRDKALYMRNTLQEYVAEVEAVTPPNYYVFIQETSRPRNRTDWVEDMDKEFSDDVKEAERLYGVTAEPQVITREVSVVSDLAVPVLVGAGIVALAIAFG